MKNNIALIFVIFRFKLNKTGREALQRFLELIIPAVLLSVLYSLLLQWGIIKTMLPNGRQSLLMYYTPMLFAIIYGAGNAVLMRRSRKRFIKLSGSRSETDEKGQPEKSDHEKSKLIDDPKGYYIANYSALAAFAILPFISRYVFDSVVFRWIFGITNWVRLAVTGLGIEHLDDVPVHVSISVFILILAVMIPLAQINVRKNYIKNLEKKQKARKERLSTATKTTVEQRENGKTEKLDIYSMAAGKQRELSDEEKVRAEDAKQLREKGKKEKMDIYSMAADNQRELSDEEKARAEESKQLREKGKKEKMDIYSMAAGNQRELSDEEKARAEESKRLREKGRTEKLDIYSMASGKKRELSDEEKAKEEESRRLREKGRQGPQRVDIYNMKKE